MLNDAICTSLISRPYTPNPCLPPCPAPAPPLPPAEGGVLALADLLRRDAPEILAEAVPALRTLSFSALPGVPPSAGAPCDGTHRGRAVLQRRKIFTFEFCLFILSLFFICFFFLKDPPPFKPKSRRRAISPGGGNFPTSRL